MARALNKTTMAKINRERRQRERRAEKQARKDRRRAEKDNPPVPVEDESTSDLQAGHGDPAGEGGSG